MRPTYFEFTCVSLRSHFGSTSIPLRIHFGFTSISLRFHCNLTLASFETHTKHKGNETKASGAFEDGVTAAPTNPSDPLNLSKIKRKLINTFKNSSRNHLASSSISQKHVSLDLAKQWRAPKHKDKGTDAGPWTTNHRMNPNNQLTHPRTIQISQVDSPSSLRYALLRGT